MEWPATSQLAGRYAVERELGRGGMATVYLVQDLKLGRRVALKVLRPELVGTLATDRFLGEIRIASRLSHAHILPLHDSGEAGGRLFYAMPFVEGQSLRQRLDQEPQQPVDETVRIVRAVAEALDYAHAQGVIHRDIKPENILLARDPGRGPDRPLVTDFGIARALDAAGGERLTQTGLALGTPAYMSPEQGSADSRVDARSDTYALGCVAYEMLAGAPPFTGPTAQAVLARHAVDPVPPLRTVRPNIPAAVEQAVARALAKVPADRFASAGDFAEALTARGPVRHRRGRRSIVLAVATLTLGSAAAAALWKAKTANPPALPVAGSIAVLPLGVAAGDSALRRLSQDLAVTVSASLDGLSGIQTADRLLVAGERLERRVLSLTDASGLARRFGASTFLRGSLVANGDQVRVDAGLYSTDSLAPLAPPFSLTMHHDSLAALTDSIAWAVLQSVWRGAAPPTPSLEAVTTRSIPALRAFLDGERELAANRWAPAGLAFAAAVAHDSGFVLAQLRYAMSQLWSDRDPEPELVASLSTHRARLPERERLLVAALLDFPALPRRLEALRALTERYPDYWPGWFYYGDTHIHHGPRLGYDWREGLAAFQRAVALEPDLVPALEHMGGLTYGRDEVEDTKILARLDELGWSGARDPLFRLENAVFRNGGVIAPEVLALADTLAARMVSSPDPAGLELSNESYTLLRGGWFPVAQLQLNAKALRLAHSDVTRSALRAANAWAWAARGQWDSALAGIAEASRLRPGVIGRARNRLFFRDAEVGGPLLAIESYALAVLGAWLGASEPGVADDRRPAAAAAAGALTDEESRRDAWGRIAWLDGLLAAGRGDGEAMTVARRAAMASGYRQADLVDKSLAAFAMALRGERDGAARELASLEEDCAATGRCNDFTPAVAVQRLAAAEWLAHAGDLERARRLLRHQDARSYPGWLFAFNDVLLGPTLLARARIEKRIGSVDRAAEYYDRFLRIFDQPTPAVAGTRAEARSALDRLRGAEPPATE